MEETIDLRPYVDALIRRWWVILGAVIAGVLVAAFLHYSQTTYRAAALVVVADPTQRLQFDPRVTSTLDLDNMLGIYPELATSDGVVSALLDEAMKLSDGAITTLPYLRSMLGVETGMDSRLMRLIVRNGDSQLAADLANSWANLFVAAVDRVYLGQSAEAEFYENLLAEANVELQEIERALVEFQSGNLISIVNNELLSLNEHQASYLADQRRLSLLLDDINTLSSQIEAGAGDTVTWADQLTALMLQMKVYETPAATPVPSEPIQLQVNPQVNLTTGNRAEQLSLLEDLAQAAATSLSEIDVKLLGLEPRILELQREKEVLFHQFDELTRNREVARETALTLVRKIDEARIQSEDSGSSLRIASLATPPASFERSSLMMMATTAGLLGFLLSSLIVIIMTWWKSSGERATA